MTKLEAARKGQLTEELRLIAHDEGVEPATVREWVAAGLVVIPANKNHAGRRPCGLGEPLRVKINADIGISPNNVSIDHELAKLRVVKELGAESVMDLSCAGDLNRMREAVIAHVPMMVGMVLICQIMTQCSDDCENSDLDEILNTIDRQGRQGVDFITIDGRKPREYRENSTNAGTEECSMRGRYCVMKMLEEVTE